MKKNKMFIKFGIKLSEQNTLNITPKHYASFKLCASNNIRDDHAIILI